MGIGQPRLRMVQPKEMVGQTGRVPWRTVCPIECRCRHRRVDCSGSGVNSSTLPRLQPNTLSLNLSNTEFKILQDGQFAYLTRLLVLDLSNASLGNISTGAFSGLTRLRYLNIAKNENYPLTNSTFSDLFKDLTSLVDLKTYGTTTANLACGYPNVVLSRLTALKHLWIDGMNNKTLGQEFSKLTQLKILRFPGDNVGFGFCDIDTLGDGMFDSVANITHLYVNFCGVQVIEGNAFANLTQLEYMDLSGNVCLELDAVSEAMKRLSSTSLSVLVLNHIYYTSAQSCGTVVGERQVAGLQHLNITRLYLESNAIVKVTKQALNVLPKTLKFLGVRNNEFEPDLYMFYVRRLDNLEGIDASYQFFPNMIWFHKDIDEEGFVTASFLRNKMNCRKKRSIEISNKVRRESARSITFPSNSRDLDEPRNIIQDDAVNEPFQHHQNKSDFYICPLPPVKVPPLIPFLPPKLKYIDISHCKLDVPIYNITIDPNNSVEKVNASRSMLTCWEGPVYGLDKLEYLDLSNNFCTRVGQNFFQEFSQLKTLLLSDNLLGIDIKRDTAGNLLKSLTLLEILTMENNRLSSIPPNFLMSQSHLQSLTLRSNLLTEFNVRLNHMQNLSWLDISHNAISTLSGTVRDEIDGVAKSVYSLNHINMTVDLSDNFIHCYCVNLDFLKWLRSLKDCKCLQVKVTNCSFQNDTQLDISDAKSLGRVIAHLERECASKMPLIVGLTAGIVLFTNIIVGITVHFYRWKLRYWWYVSRVHVKRRSDGYRELENILADVHSRWKYDVYVAYAPEEKEAEFVKEMVEYLETKNDMRLCDSDRDFVPGQSDYRMISNAIHVSCVSIFIVTDNSTRDGRWEIAMRMSQEESLNRGKRAYFGIFLDGIPRCISENKKMVDLSDLVKANAYLEYPKASQMNVINGFWNQCIEKIHMHKEADEDD